MSSAVIPTSHSSWDTITTFVSAQIKKGPPVIPAFANLEKALTGHSALKKGQLDEVVRRYVNAVEAIDVHTHLLPPTHANLLLFGIDELLTYHYLVAELFMVLPIDLEEDTVSTQFDAAAQAPTTDEFFSWPKAKQADLVFEELFIKRTPLSEACRGVITCLKMLSLGEALSRAARADAPRDSRLTEVRAWFAEQEPAEYLEKVFGLAGLKYA
eukprot:683917-Prymnesium_polylepis.1